MFQANGRETVDKNKEPELGEAANEASEVREGQTSAAWNYNNRPRKCC